MKSPAPTTRQMAKFLAISFIAAIYLVPTVRAAPSLPSRRLPSTPTTATTISHSPSAHETPQDLEPLPLHKQQEQQMWEEVRRAQEQRSDPYAWNPNFPPPLPRGPRGPGPRYRIGPAPLDSIFGEASASSDVGPSSTATSTPPLKKRDTGDTNKSEQKEEKGNIFWPKDSVEKISTWLKGQKNKILSQVGKIKGKNGYGVGAGSGSGSSSSYQDGSGHKNGEADVDNEKVNSLGSIIGLGRNDDDYKELPGPVPVNMEKTFQHPENATQAERFRNVLLLEAPTQVRPGVKLNADFSTIRSTINGVSGVEYYGNGSGSGYGYGYGYSYGSVAAGVFAITLLWMIVRRRPATFGSGFPCSRPGWVGCLVERWKGVEGLEGGQVEEIRRGRALLRED